MNDRFQYPLFLYIFLLVFSVWVWLRLLLFFFTFPQLLFGLVLGSFFFPSKKKEKLLFK